MQRIKTKTFITTSIFFWLGNHWMVSKKKLTIVIFWLNKAFLVSYLCVSFLIDLYTRNIFRLADSFYTVRFTPGLAYHFQFRITITTDHPFRFENICSNDNICGLKEWVSLSKCVRHVFIITFDTRWSRTQTITWLVFYVPRRIFCYQTSIFNFKEF